MKKYTIPILTRLRARILRQSLLALMLLLGIQNVYAALSTQQIAELSRTVMDSTLVTNSNLTTPEQLKFFTEKGSVGNMLLTNQTLADNQRLESSNGAFYAGTNKNGQFVIYSSTGIPIWLSATSAAPNGKIVMQGDGNLCLYPSGNGGQVWCSRSNSATGSYFTILRDTGVLEIYKGDPKNINPDNLIWTSLLDPVYYNNRYADLNNAYHGDWIQLMYHWITYGRYEARSPRAGISDELFQKIRDVHLDPTYYVNKYPDVYKALGRDPAKLFGHWITYGIKEGRIPNSGVDNFLKEPPRTANGRKYMRIGDWLYNEERLVSNNGQYIAMMQTDGNFVIYNSKEPNANTRVWWQWGSNSKAHGGDHFMTIQKDGHFCTYDDPYRKNEQTNKNLDQHGQGIACSPGNADAGLIDANGKMTLGSYYISLEDDGNMLIHRGPGPDDDRGIIWQSNNARPKPQKSWWQKGMDEIGNVTVSFGRGVGTVLDGIGSWATNAANTMANASQQGIQLASGTMWNASEILYNEINNNDCVQKLGKGKTC